MAKSVMCKLLQKQTYDVLSQRYAIVLLFVGMVLLGVSAFHFGEAMLEWSKEKYSAVFNSYSDNIAGRSYQHHLCQYVPVDVVYTWVNGSDPKLLSELVEAKQQLVQQLGYSSSSQSRKCTYLHCVPSHMVLVLPKLSKDITLADLEEAHSVLNGVTRVFGVNSRIGEKLTNVSVLVFDSLEEAAAAVTQGQFQLDEANYTIIPAYLSNDWMAVNTVALDRSLMVLGVPSGCTAGVLRSKLPSSVSTAIEKIFCFEEKSLCILTVTSKHAQDTLLHHGNVTFENKSLKWTAAYLVVEPLAENSDFSASRFADNEELRYSLRSLEKHAPWIRHVYIVTSGQIPYWLNLDNPKVTIVTHEELFLNKSHLPTFSSPAIETHMHRIPGLSGKFLYLNDDVLFGKDVWPEDFFTHARGQKVYLSWPVPDCAEGCPSSWIKDGYCDKPCNNSECQWDGGDCMGQQGYHLPGGFPGLLSDDAERLYCNPSCSNSWLSDRYCDQACNVRVCGFDAGDCGTDNYHQLFGLTLVENQNHYFLPPGETLAYFNLTTFLGSDGTVTEGQFEDNRAVRIVAVSQKYKVLTLVLYPSQNATNLTLTMMGKKSGKKYELTFRVLVNTKESTNIVSVTASSSAQLTSLSIPFENFSEDMRFPKVVNMPCGSACGNLNLALVNISDPSLSKDVIKEMKNLDEMLKQGYLTEKGYQIRRAQMAEKFVQNFTAHALARPKLLMMNPAEFVESVHRMARLWSERGNPKLQNRTDGKAAGPKGPPQHYGPLVSDSGEKAPVDGHQNPEGEELIRIRKLSSLDRHLGVFPWEKQGVFHDLERLGSEQQLEDSYGTPGRKTRHLLDTFGNSLRHVNKLYNDAFGYEARKVPAHIAHFVDLDVVVRMQARFPEYFDITSSHKIRSSNDMQFAFAYYYYLMSETAAVDTGEIFDKFDTDHSGTWSDREVRTVLTHLYDLPLDYSSVRQFENYIVNCSQHLGPECSQHVSTPPYERYHDSNLPTVSRSLVVACSSVSSMLQKLFGIKKANKFEVLGEDEVAFKMIHSNLSQVIGQIDDIRKNPKKFICLNDNINHRGKDAEIIKAVLQDFYESFYPTRSQFELPPEYRNRFLHLNELKEWRQFRDWIRLVTYCSLGLLITFTAASFYMSQLRPRADAAASRRHTRSSNVAEALEV